MTGGRDVCGALRTYYDCDNWPVRAVPIVCYVRRRSATAMIYAKAAGDGMMSQPAQEPVGEKGIRTTYVAILGIQRVPNDVDVMSPGCLSI